MVPVTKAIGSYNGKMFDFWVYGDDHRCHAPNYPAQCCCGCTTYLGVCFKSALVLLEKRGNVLFPRPDGHSGEESRFRLSRSVIIMDIRDIYL